MKDVIQKPDSLIFDMDGTLWDNLSTYVIAWNAAFKELGYSVEVTRDSLQSQMGKEAGQILKNLVPDAPVEKQEVLFDVVIEQYQKLVPNMKPVIYPGVLEGLKKLHTKYKLLLLSNCEEGGLVNLMDYTQTAHLFIDYKEHGKNNMPKSHNLKLLKERNNLKNPVYIGDTEGDSYETKLAGLPFVFVSYGFGKTENYDLKFDSFTALTNYFMSL